jgi:hypothetical protein
MNFDDLVQGPGERHLVFGSSRSGKSSLEDWSIRHIQRTRPECMILVMDTKPRFRAERIPYGYRGRWRKDANGLYTGWTKGPLVPNSVAVDIHAEFPFRGLWDMDKNPGEIAIMQTDEPSEWKQMLELARHFVKKKTQRERLIVVDEGMDFYQRNSMGIDARNDVILHAARAGGERGIGLLFCAHRPYGIPPLLNTLVSRATVFHLRFLKDMQYIWQMGVPEGQQPPAGDYIFDQYTIRPGGVVSEPFTGRLSLPQSYLDQLSAT